MRSTTTATTTKPRTLSNRFRICVPAMSWRQSFAICLAMSSLLTRGMVAQNTGAATASSPQPSQFTIISSGLQNIPISPGDLLDVEVFNTPELSARLRVDQVGRVAPPLGGDVEVQGLNVAAAASAIQAALLSGNIMLHPSVTVNIVEYATEGVTVLGEVRSPGIYTLLGPHSLYDALASAGGASPSEGATIAVTHINDAAHPIIVKVTTPNYSPEQKAMVIQPGDTVVVSRADIVYVVGDVNRSGAFYIQNGQPLTVLDLVSLAQGPTRTAAVSHVALIRNTLNGAPVTVPFNLNKVMKNQAKNIVLEAGDVLVVPRSGWKTFGTTALPALTNAAVNAVSIALVN
jgi:polysaccharide export outer membrane protein